MAGNFMDEDFIGEAVPAGPFRWAGVTDVGRDRDENEDSYIVEPESGLFIVSDGMGGHRGGKLAAKIVTEDLSAMIDAGLHKMRSSSTRAVRRMLGTAIMEQNRHLYMEGDSESGYKGMGATLVMALLRDGRAYIANLGDSRMYRLRKRRFVQLTRDHSVVGELIDAGELEPEDAEEHDSAGEITHYVGMEDKAAAHLHSFGLVRGDRLLLGTDGLSGMVSDRMIAAILRGKAEPQEACDELVRLANASGGHDNITVVVIDWNGR
jgi:protein phosphatase